MCISRRPRRQGEDKWFCSCWLSRTKAGESVFTTAKPNRSPSIALHRLIGTGMLLKMLFLAAPTYIMKKTTSSFDVGIVSRYTGHSSLPLNAVESQGTYRPHPGTDQAPGWCYMPLWEAWKHQPLNRDDRQHLCCLIIERSEGCSWQERVSLLCFCLSAGTVQILWTEGGVLPSQGIPNALKNVVPHAFLPNTLALILYWSPSQAISAAWFTQLFRSGADWPGPATGHQRCRSVLVFRQRMRLINLVFDSPPWTLWALW